MKKRMNGISESPRYAPFPASCETKEVDAVLNLPMKLKVAEWESLEASDTPTRASTYKKFRNRHILDALTMSFFQWEKVHNVSRRVLQ